MVMGLYPFRCLDCRHRFWVNVWRLPKSKFVRCPHCLNLDVTLSHYRATRPAMLKKFVRTIGARRFSCPLCHHRFLSFKRSETVDDGEIPTGKAQAAHS